MIASVSVVGSGHFYNQYLAYTQPMKMAASEALWETAEPAPFIIFAIIDEDNRKNSYQLALRAGLSVLAYNSMNTPVKGMNDLQVEFVEKYGPGHYIPAVTILFWSFRGMVGIGFWLVFLAALESYDVEPSLTIPGYHPGLDDDRDGQAALDYLRLAADKERHLQSCICCEYRNLFAGLYSDIHRHHFSSPLYYSSHYS